MPEFDLGSATVDIKADLDPFRRGMRQARQEADQTTNEMTRGFNRTGLSIGQLATRAAALYAAFKGLQAVTRDFIQTADTFRRLEGQFTAITNSVERGRQIFANTVETARAAGVAIEDVGASMTRFTLAAEELGKNDQQVQQFTENLLKMGRIGGSSQASLSAGAVQLAQGLGAGVLRGDELNSVLENLPLVAKAIADELGVGIGKLKEMGANGEILAEDVFNAILNKTEEIERQFSQLPPTMDQVSSQLATAWQQFTAEIDNSIGATERLVALMQSAIGLLDNLRTDIQNVERWSGQRDRFVELGRQGLPLDFNGPVVSDEQLAAMRDAGARRTPDLTPDPIERMTNAERNLHKLGEEAKLAAQDFSTAANSVERDMARINAAAAADLGAEGGPTPTARPTPDLRDEKPFSTGRSSRGGGGGRSASSSSISAVERLLQTQRERIALLEHEAILVGRSEREQLRLTQAFNKERVERELLQAAGRDGVPLTEDQIRLAADYAQASEDLTLAMFDQKQAQEDADDAARRAAASQEALASGIAHVSSSMIQGIQRANSFSDALRNVALSLLDVALQASVGQGPLGGVFNSILGVDVGGLLGLLIPPAPVIAPVTSPIPLPRPGFANGGRPPKNRMVMVGERGPEPVVFGEDARVMSNEDMKDAIRGGGRKAAGSGVPEVHYYDLKGVTAAEMEAFVDRKIRESQRKAPRVTTEVTRRGY